MSKGLSRRKLAEYVAIQLQTGKRDVLKQLAAYLVEQRRTKEASMILHDVAWQLANTGNVLGTVISAFDLEADTMRAIEAYIKDELKAQTVVLSNKIDENAIGGYKVTLPGYEMDRTIRQQLINMKSQLKEA